MKKKYVSILLIMFLSLGLGCAGNRGDHQKEDVESSKPSKEGHRDPEEKGEEHGREIHLSTEKLARLKIETTKVKKGVFPNLVEAVGKVGFNERRRVDLVARTAGRVEKIHVFSGDYVKRGALLVEIYSPDYLSAQTDFIQWAARVAQEENGEASTAVKALLKASEEKMALFGENKSEIQDLLETKTPKALLHIHAPFSGTVVVSKSVVGRNLSEGDLLLTFADLSTVWVAIDIYEKDLSRVVLGSPVTIVPDAYPNQKFQATVKMIGVNVEEKTRTVEARAEMGNENGILKPGMFVRAKMESSSSDGRKGFLIPTVAVVKLDQKEGVFIDEGGGEFKFQPILVRQRSSVWTEIESGLKENDSVVTQGTFFLKSELSKGELGEGHSH